MPEIKAGTTDVTTYIKLVDPTSGDEEPNLVITSLVMFYAREKTAVVSAAATATSSFSAAHASTTMVQVNATTCKGLYRCDWPDAAFAAGVPKVIVGVRGTAVDTAMEQWLLKDFDISDIGGQLTTIDQDTSDIKATAASWLAGAGVLSNIWSETTALVTAVSDVKSELVIVSDAMSDMTQAHIILATTIGPNNRSTTSCELVAGSDNDNAYVGMLVILDDDATDGEYVSRTVTAYTGVSKTITWSPAITEDAGDGGTIYIVPGNTTLVPAVAALSTKIGSDVLLLEAALDSDFLALEGALDSDALLYLADHDKTQSDVALITAQINSEMVILEADHDKTQSDIALVDAAIDSDAVLYTASISDVKSAITVLDAAIDSDALLADADHDKTQSDIALLSTKQDSDMVVVATATSNIHSLLTLVRSDTTAIEAAGGALTSAQAAQLTTIASDLVLVYSDTTVIEAGGGALTSAQAAQLTTIASDLVIVASDVIVVDQDTSDIKTKIDSDALLEAADHDKTQSDVALLSTKQDSDMVVVATATSDIKSELVLVHSETTLIDAADTEPASVPAANASMKAKIGWLFALGRNRITTTATTQIVKADDGTTTVGTSTHSDDGVTHTRGEWA